MDVIAWNENEIDKMHVWHNRVVRVALNAPMYTAVEAPRGDIGKVGGLRCISAWLRALISRLLGL